MKFKIRLDRTDNEWSKRFNADMKARNRVEYWSLCAFMLAGMVSFVVGFVQPFDQGMPLLLLAVLLLLGPLAIIMDLQYRYTARTGDIKPSVLKQMDKEEAEHGA